jgi:hypothetical protein
LALDIWEFTLFKLYETPFAIDTKVNAEGLTLIEVEKHLFADCPGFGEFASRDELGAC